MKKTKLACDSDDQWSAYSGDRQTIQIHETQQLARLGFDLRTKRKRLAEIIKQTNKRKK